ncbi:hypothetical protein SBADM41S_07494 [Streptomyces badius]
MEDSDEWIHRLKIVGIDLRDPAQVVALADSVAAEGPLDILINNAAQTVRRSPGAYSELVGLRGVGAAAGGELPAAEVIGTFNSGSVDRVAALPSARREGLSAQEVTDLALVTGSASPPDRRGHPRSTRAASSPTCTTPTAGSRRSTRSSRSSSSKSSSATPPHRSS